MSEIAVVERPVGEARRGGGLTLAALLRDTLTTGKALSVPIRVGENYAITRNRTAATGYKVSRELGVRLRTSSSADRSAVLVWLEPKA